VSTAPASPAKQAREALGTRLRELRRDAGFTGRVLADRIGIHFTKVSRIEHGAQAPTEANIRAWCRACRVEDQVVDLIATARAVESMYIEWRRQTRAGMKRLMTSSAPLYERTKLFRIYEYNVIPGLFQTAEYSAAILSYFIDFLDAPDDLEAAIEARIERQRVIYSGDRRFLVVIEEQAVRKQVGNVDTMAGQLDRLLVVMSLPRVSLAIIPEATPRTVFAHVGFWIYDDAAVGVETPTASLKISQPREIRLYAKMFEQLRQVAAYGAEARSLVTKAMADLTREQPAQMDLPGHETAIEVGELREDGADGRTTDG
jgi:transcriptional regulator with XRE-family HTH domain